MPEKRRLPAGWLLAIVLLLLFHLFLRVHNADLQDPYIDEGFHVERASFVWDFERHPGRVSNGKLLLYFWLGIFETGPLTSLQMSRIGLALFSMLTGATIFLIGRMLGNKHIGLLALAIYAIFPLAVFYERMAMADPFAAGLATLVVWRSLVFVRHPTLYQGAIVGGLIALTTLAKLTMGLTPLIPVLAAVIYYPWQMKQELKPQFIAWLKRYFPALVMAAVIVVVAWLPILIPAALALGTDDPFYIVNPFNVQQQTESVSPFIYVKTVTLYLSDFFSWPLIWGLVGSAILWTVLALGVIKSGIINRNGLMLLTWLLTTIGLILVSASLITTRYVMPMAIPLVIAMAYMLVLLWEMKQPWRFVSMALSAGLVLWAFGYALPFNYVMITDPEDLSLSRRNYREFQMGTLNADDALRSAADLLDEQSNPDRAVYASWHTCPLLYFYLERDRTCLDQWEDPEDFEKRLRGNLAPGEYAYLLQSDHDEQLQEETPNVEYEEIARYPNAQETRSVSVYRVWLQPKS